MTSLQHPRVCGRRCGGCARSALCSRRSRAAGRWRGPPCPHSPAWAPARARRLRPWCRAASCTASGRLQAWEASDLRVHSHGIDRAMILVHGVTQQAR